MNLSSQAYSAAASACLPIQQDAYQAAESADFAWWFKLMYSATADAYLSIQ